jgi:spore germination cell wall hydrolase CwlJ-like protein
MTTKANKLKEYGALNLLTACIYGEARGEPLLGKFAVAWVIRNRTRDKRWPNTFEDVILQPKQFSCMNPDDPNYDEVLKALLPSRNANSINMDWRECRIAAHAVISQIPWCYDPTNEANHYHAASIKIPYWAKNKYPVEAIGNHWFYKL